MIGNQNPPVDKQSNYSMYFLAISCTAESHRILVMDKYMLTNFGLQEVVWGLFKVTYCYFELRMMLRVNPSTICPILNVILPIKSIYIINTNT